MDKNIKSCIGCKFAALDRTGYCCAEVHANIPFPKPISVYDMDIYYSKDDDNAIITEDMLPDNCVAVHHFAEMIEDYIDTMVKCIEDGCGEAYRLHRSNMLRMLCAMDMLIEEMGR